MNWWNGCGMAGGTAMGEFLHDSFSACFTGQVCYQVSEGGSWVMFFLLSFFTTQHVDNSLQT